MMLDSQVCALELAKKLKEFGVEQESLFYYLNIDGEGKYYIYFNEHMPEDFEYEGDPISAFTAVELFALLPYRITLPEGEPFNSFKLNMIKSIYIPDAVLDGKIETCALYILNYECDSTACYGEEAWLRRQLMKNCCDAMLQDCAAKMLIYLIENKLIEILT